MYLIGYLINAVLLNVYTIICFFVKKFICSNVYISVNAIFECLYIIFWLRKGPLMKYLRNWQLVGMGGSSRIRTDVYNGRGSHASCVCTHLHNLFSCFLQHFCLIVSCFICRNLTLLFFFDVFVRNSYFSPTRSISAVMK